MNQLKELIKKHLLWAVCLFLIFIISIYWTFVATDRYVSEAHVVLQSPNISNTINTDISALFSTDTNNSKDLLILAEYLKSVDMLKQLDSSLGLKEHYSDTHIDFFFRLDKDIPMEYFHEYYLKRIHIEVDDYAGVLVIKSEAFSKDMAYKISTLLLELGEKHMNQMGQRLAIEQVDFIQKQVLELGDKLSKARDALLKYQNKHGLVSPVDTVESVSQVVASLEAKLSAMNAKKTAMSDYLSRNSAEIIKINSEIRALRKQIAMEKAKMTKRSGRALNTISADYETLQLQAQFALELYSNSLAALESTRVEAIRKLKQVSVLQTPTYPEYAVEPKRLYNITVFIILSVFITLIVQMLSAIINEHNE